MSDDARQMKGSITASCGHVLTDDETTISVRYRDEVCDAFEGFLPCITYAEFCPNCAAAWEARGWLMAEDEPDDF